MFRNRSLRLALATVLVTAGAGVVLATAGGAAPSVVRLHLGSDGRFFQYGTTTQPLTTASNSCKINSAEPVMRLTSTGTQSAPGLGADAIGVKASPSSGNGTPCSQVDGTESLRLKPGTGIANRTFTGVRLDLEMTGNATVKLTLSSSATSAVYQLQTGTCITQPQLAETDYDTSAPYFASSSPGDTTDACAAPNSSGPNSGQNDNCEWTVQPGFNFDTVTLTTMSGGTVALEGSNDFANNPNFDSQFFLSNAAPTAVDDTVTTPEDTPVSGNVLTNDSDSDGNPLSASVVSGPFHGTLSFAASGAFTYTPNANYNGPDAFSYAASDGAASTNANVAITVGAVNDAPVAGDDTAEVNQKSSVEIPVLANDSDVDGNTLVPGDFGSISPAGSTVIANADGTVTFTPPATPAPGYTGPASFTYRASDGTATSNVATVSVTVFPAICSNETVSATDGGVTGSFTRLDDSFNCKRYALDASAADGTVSFLPTGATTVDYRGFVTLGSDPAPVAGGSGTFTLLLKYDPTGGTNFRPVQWCIAPQFDGAGLVTSATIPAGETWCIAGENTRPNATNELVTTWQVFGQDDPTFARR